MLDIKVYNLSVHVYTDDEKISNLIDNFLDENYKQNNLGKKEDEESFYVYASITKDRKNFYLHRRQYTHLLDYISKKFPQYEDYFKVNKDHFFDHYKSEPLNLLFNSKIELRDYQKDIVDFLCQEKCRSKLVPLQTGKGKTVIGLNYVCKINKRLAIVILPTYIDKWVSDVKNLTNIKDDEICVIQGSKTLKSCIDLAKQNEYDYPITIISLTTIRNAIDEYEEDPEFFKFNYGIEPIELFPLLGVGVLLVDETHQHFYGLYKTLLHSNVEKQVGLSATLTTDQPILKRVHHIVYHSQCRYESVDYDRYAYIYSIGYQISDHYIKKIRTSEYGSNNYSHNAFEKSILRNDHIFKRYMNLIHVTVEDYFMDEYQEKDKLIIFVSTVNMATEVTSYLSKVYPQFDIRRYCEQDPYENVIEPDIRVTTAMSAGTAVDIPNLRVAIQTVNVSSPVTNLQVLGRLRKLSDRDVKFCYLFALNIPKHYFYHVKRKELFYPKAKSFLERRSSVNI